MIETILLMRLAEDIRTRITRRAIRFLQTLGRDSMLSGDDSGLESIWDEVCVQVQAGESIFWDAYLQALTDFAEDAVERLSEPEQAALWLQTFPGEQWLEEAEHAWSRGEKRRQVPAYARDTAEWIREHVLEEARSWSNHRIRSFHEAGL